MKAVVINTPVRWSAEFDVLSEVVWIQRDGAPYAGYFWKTQSFLDSRRRPIEVPDVVRIIAEGEASSGLARAAENSRRA